MLKRRFARYGIFLAGALLSTVAYAVPGSLEFFVNNSGAGNYDHGEQVDIPDGFGSGEFTLEIWIKPNDSFPVGPTGGGGNKRDNWTSEDVAPYSSGSWWFNGNFLLDGHNNNTFRNGTFSLQFYGGGRVRWLFGDGSSSIPSGGLWSIGAYPATGTASLLDGNWHHLTLVRRWAATSSAQLELWIDGALIDTETSDVRTDMTTWWNNWAGFPSNQAGWFWAAEKQAAIGSLSQWEDYKGLVDEVRFWSRAKSSAEIVAGYANPVTGGEPGLVGYFAFEEGAGNSSCDGLSPTRCIALNNSFPGTWNTENAPLSTSGDTTAPSVPGNLQGSGVSSSAIDLIWSAATDNIGVTGYEVRRDGLLVATIAQTTYTDTGLIANTSYTYTVAARDAAGNVSAESTAVTATTLAGSDTEAPSVPTNVQGTAVSSSQIDLTWSESTDNVGVTGYQVWRNGALVGTVATNGFSDTGLTANTSYNYSVAAQDAAGNVSPTSSTITVTTQGGTDTEAPSVPANLQGNGASPSQIDLTWSASSDNVGVTGYEISRDGTVIATVGVTSFSDTGLTANTSYSYTVAARDAAGNVSAGSSSILVSTLAAADTEAPTVPTGLQANAISSTRIDLSWTESSDNVGVSGYDVTRDGSVVATVTQASYSDTGLSPATQYEYAVIARDAAGNVSASSATVTESTATGIDSEAPSIPVGLQGSAASTTRIDLQWSPSTDNVAVTGYEIKRDGVLVASTPNTNFSDTGLSANTSYNYAVAARDAAGNVSADSTAITVSTLAAPDTQAPSIPANVSARAASSSSITVSWDASTDNVGVVEYRVLRSGVQIAATSGTTYTDNGLSAGTTYSYTIVAVDLANNVSAESVAASATTPALAQSPGLGSSSGGGSTGPVLLLFLLFVRGLRAKPRLSCRMA